MVNSFIFKCYWKKFILKYLFTLLQFLFQVQKQTKGTDMAGVVNYCNKVCEEEYEENGQ